jgi:hypothetical protein
MIIRMALQHHAIFAVLSGGRPLASGGQEACLGLKICIFHPHDSTKTPFQQLREVIRDDRHLPWKNAEHPEYKTFKVLAVRVAALLGRHWPSGFPSSERAANQLIRITSNRWMGGWVDSSLHKD